MKVPNKIYIDYEADESGVYMSLTAPHDEAIEYIRKEALVEWLNAVYVRLNNAPGNDVNTGYLLAIENMTNHINEM